MRFRVKFSAAAVALWVSAGLALIGAEAAAQDIPREGSEYQVCYEKLTQEPLASYSQRIIDGGVTNTRRILLETELGGIRCSDAQLIAFMEQHGMPFEVTTESEQPIRTGHGVYDRMLHFCIVGTTLFDRLLWGECDGAVHIAMLGDRVSYAIAHAAK